MAWRRGPSRTSASPGAHSLLATWRPGPTKTSRRKWSPPRWPQPSRGMTSPCLGGRIRECLYVNKGEFLKVYVYYVYLCSYDRYDNAKYFVLSFILFKPFQGFLLPVKNFFERREVKKGSCMYIHDALMKSYLRETCG